MSTAAAVSRWLFLLLSLSSWTIVYTKEARIVCYYTNWSVYRPGDAKFTPQNINPYLCTHLIYAFGGFTKENTLKPFDKYQDIEKGGYAKFTGLKTYNKNLKTLLAIGGWNEGSTRFSPLVASEERRKELVKNSVKFLRQNHFDGLDLDWEYPSFRDGGKPRDRANYAQFVQELREEFERESQKTGRPRLLLTMAVPAGIEYINKGYDVPKLTKYLDWMNILSYDYHSAFEPSVNHHAPLYPLEEDNEYNYDAELTIDYTIKHYLKLGADPSKLVLGIPTYGRSYTLFNPDAFEMGSPADGPGTMGEATRENGYLAYYEICEYVNDQDWEVEEPNPKAMGPYAFKDNQWVGYDDENMVKRKSEYVAENGLGGIMFWAIDNDDFRGKCHGKSYPLIEAGKEALLQAYGLTEDNLIAPPTKPIKSRTRNRSKTTETPNIKIEEKEVKIDKISSRRRNRIKPNVKEVEDVKEIKETAKSRRKLRRKQTSTTEEPITHSSLKVATPSYTTPEPPSTPDMGGAFKCEDEGFYPHPKDCKKYFWCLSGAGDSGLIAHQFTCPAGLYFNKAADSCDYTQNVLCNKKLQKPKTSTSGSGTSSSTTATPIFSTSRVPPKITAATSKNTIRITSTTEAIEEEYEDEYEDEEEEKEKPSKTSTNAEPEEDPQVIKELIDLIKKAGGIEQLERQLQLNEKGDNLKDKTTESTIGKSLYERVLSKALKNTINSKKTSYTRPKNSRGQQSETSNEELKNRGKTKKGTLQYTSISRTRPSTAENEEEVVEEVSAKTVSDPTKLSTTFRKQNELQYVNIRRGRVSSTTEAPETNSVLNRNKILGEDSFEEEEEDDVKEGEREDSNENTKKTPQYVNIRRQRPSTTEGPATSKYVEIRRSTTESNDEKASDDVTSKYQTIRRVSTPAPTSDENGVLSEEQINLRSTIAPAVALEDSTFKYVNIRQSTTNNPSAIDDQKLLGTIAEKGGVTTSFVSPNTEAGFSVSETTTSSSSSKTDETLSNSEISSTKTTNDPIGSNQELFTVTDSTNTSNIRNITKSFSRPSFFITRTSTVRPTTESTTQSSKVSQSNIKFRPRSRTDSQTTETSDLTEPTEKNPTSNRRAFSRYRYQTTETSVTPNQEESVSSLQPRRRIISTTPKVFEENRSYRPHELADLSSLTSVDFEKLKEFNNNLENRRRRKPARISVSTTSTTTEEPDESLKTSSRTLPLARKLINLSNFGKSRRVIDSKNVTSSNSETSESAIRNNPVPAASESHSTNATPRPRKIIRRFRTTTTTTTTTTPTTQDQETKETQNIVGLFSQNRTDAKKILFKPKPATLFPLENKDDDDNDDSFEDNINEEEENIKLSESNIRENSELNTFGSDHKVRKFAGQKSGSIYRGSGFKEQKNPTEFGSKFSTATEKQRDVVSTSEPSVVLRTRKIIRKVIPSENSNTFSTTNEKDGAVGRKRKIIRKLRPVGKFEDDMKNVTTLESSTENSVSLISVQSDKAAKITKTIPESTVISENITNEQLSITERNLNEKVFPRRILNPRLPSLNEENADDFNRYRIKLNGRNDSNSQESIFTAKLQRIKPNNTDADDVKPKLAGSREKNIYKQYHLRVRTTTERNNVDRETAPSPTPEEITIVNVSNSDSENDAFTANLDKKKLSSDVPETTTTDTIPYADDSTDLKESLNSDIEDDLPNKTLNEIITVNNEIINDTTTEVSVNNDSLTTTDQESDLAETTLEPDLQQQTSSTQPTPSTESLLKRFNAKRQEYRPKFGRYSSSTTTDSTKPKTKPKYRPFSRKAINAETSEAKLISDEKSPTRSKYNRYRFRSTTVKVPVQNTETKNTETMNSTIVENFNEAMTENQTESSQLVNIVHTTADESSVINVLDSTTESIPITTIIDENISTQETTIFTADVTTSYSTEKTVSIESVNDETIFTTDPIELSTSFIEDKSTIVPLQESATIDNTVESTTIAEMTTTDSEITNHILENEINSITDATDVSTEEITTGVVSSTSTMAITTKPTTSTNSSATTRSGKSLLSSLSGRTNFIPTKSKLPSYRSKAKLSFNQLTTEKTETVKEPSIPSYRRFNKFSDRSSTTHRSIFSTTRFQKPLTRRPETKFSSTISSNPINNLFKFKSTTEPSEFDENNDERQYEEYDEEENNEQTEEDEDNEPPQNFNTFTVKEPINTDKIVNKPMFTKKSAGRVANTPFVPKVTESPQPNKELEDIDTAAIKLRNKNLFAKQRKMNTPFVLKIQSSTLEGITTVDEITSSYDTLEDTRSSTTDSPTELRDTQSGTTEYPTTLYHVFAEMGDTIKTTTEGLNNVVDTTTNKIERLIEVNRIVQVKTKEDIIKNHVLSKQKVDEVNSTLDKIGEVSRITVIKVVDENGNSKNISENEINQIIPVAPVYTGETTADPQEPNKSSVDAIIEIAKVQEIPAELAMGKVNLTKVLIEVNNNNPVKPIREERKFEIFGGSKISNSNSNNKQPYHGKAEIIDGISHINIITPRPLYHTEASTIALEGLFQTKKSDTVLDKDNQVSKDEVLETEHSRFVNVRVLHPEESARLEQGIRDKSKIIPIKVLKQDEEEVTMRARVVEVKPVHSGDMIKISPIKIEMFKRAAKNLPIYTIDKQNTPPT